MAAGGRNPQKSAMARAKAQAKMAGDAKGGGGKEGIAARSGANMAAKMDETAARKAQVKENARLKAEKHEQDEARYRREKAKFDKEEAKKAELAGAGGGEGAEVKLKALEAKLMPLVKEGDKMIKAGQVAEGLAKVQEAMDGFRAAGFKRPKLKEKIDGAKALLAAAEPEPDADFDS